MRKLWLKIYRITLVMNWRKAMENKTEKPQKKLLLIDSSAIIFRSFFATSMYTCNGTSTSAIYGFFNTLQKLIKDFNPDYILCCQDVKRSSLKRKQLLEAYKSDRAPMPQDLYHQFGAIDEMLNILGISKLKIEGYEADDVLASVANKFCNELQIVIVTGDKDLLQNVKNNVSVATLSKVEQKGYKLNITRDDVIDTIGVPPNYIPDLFGLMGDSVDGIPGIHGVGHKTAIRLLAEYYTLDGVYNNIHLVRGKLKEKLIENKAIAYLSKQLATANITNIDIDINSLSLTKFADLSKERKLDFLNFCRRYEFNSFIKRYSLEDLER